MELLDAETEKEFFGSAPPPAGGAVWMLSFADLLSVLLTFFVMLYSTTAIQNEKWENFLKAFKDQFHGTQHSANIEAYLPQTQAVPQEASGSDLDYLKTILSEKITSYPELHKTKVTRSHNRLTLSFPLDSFFKNNIFSPKDAQGIIANLVALFNLLDNRIDVAVVIPSDDNSTQQGVWENALMQARRISTEVTGYGYRHPINAYSYLAPYQKGDEASAKVSHIDFIIRETANQ